MRATETYIALYDVVIFITQDTEFYNNKKGCQFAKDSQKYEMYQRENKNNERSRRLRHFKPNSLFAFNQRK